MKKFKPNLEYFENSISKLKTYFTLKKFDFAPIEVTSNSPCIYVSPKTSQIDKHLISKCIKDKFVFLRDEIIEKISLGKLNQKEHEQLLDEIKTLSDENYSLSIIYGSIPTIFGKNENLSESLILFLRATKLDIKFLTFPGEYFAYPIWADEPRNTRIYACQQITIKQKFLEGFSKKEIFEQFSHSTPSSASTYLSKYPVSINSNKLAVGLDRVVYACPHCKKLLSVYSEFSCLKCKECGMVAEFSPDGKILFSNNLSSFDDIENFQFKCLIKNDLTINELKTYNNVIQIISEKCKKQIKLNVILQIYAETLVIKNSVTGKKVSIKYEDIELFNLSYNNILKFKTKNAKEFCFVGKSNENFLIIRDLIKLNKN